MVRGIRSVGVIGTGTIGLGWAMLFARNHLETYLYDQDGARASAARDRTVEDLVQSVAGTGGAILGLADTIHVARSIDELRQAGVTYVQESVPEELRTKVDVFRQLNTLLPSAILASSTSAFPMSKIARGLRDARRCIVAHPMNPPDVIPLVEVVPGERTSPATTTRTVEFLQSIGKRTIVCRKEIFGFVVNRLQYSLFREALFLARSGIASPEDIDRCVSDGLGLRWAFAGPFLAEEMQAPLGVDETLSKFRSLIASLMNDTRHEVYELDDHDIELIGQGVRRELEGVSHEALLKHRDRLVAGILALKANSWSDALASAGIGPGEE